MRIVIFGLTISSSWGNGHATLWRGLCRGLARRGHSVVFFERDVPYYAEHRDLQSMDDGELVLYSDWPRAAARARRELSRADVGIVTSYCVDGVAASRLVTQSHNALRVFYDLDTPVTLDRLQSGGEVPYLPPEGLGDFDLVLSYTGGRALDLLGDLLGAHTTAPLYGSVDPLVHRPMGPHAPFAADISYLGTYADDRQNELERLLIEPARRMPDKRFVIGGAQYPDSFPWTPNIFFVSHLPPADHAAFFSSSPLTLNVTRRSMAAMGYCPSGRLFEAAACGCTIVTDEWEGLDRFFEPDEEILIARHADDVQAAMSLPPERLAAIGRAGRRRALAEHSADTRAGELETMLTRGMTESEAA